MSFLQEHAHSNNLKEIDRLTDDIQRELQETIKKTIIDDDIEFTGGLRESVDKDKEGEFKAVTIRSPYGGLVEWGLLPGVRPNFDALRNWVEHKLGITDEDELNTATIKISNKIHNEGIAPKLFVKKSIRRFIAKRGYKRVRMPRQKPGMLDRIIKSIRKINRNMRKINKYAVKVGKTRRGKI